MQEEFSLLLLLHINKNSGMVSSVSSAQRAPVRGMDFQPGRHSTGKIRLQS